MKNTTSRISLTLLLMTVSSALVAADSMQAIADRTLIRELMDRYGIVHDSGTPEEYADLFTADGEIAVASGGPAIVKGREALIAQARRDHERFGNEPAANGKTTSIMAPDQQRADHDHRRPHGDGHLLRHDGGEER